MPGGFSVGSGPMRPAIIRLLLLLLTVGGLRAENTLTLQVTPDREFYLAGGRHSIYLELKIGAPAAPVVPGGEAAPRRNVVLVLDRSGSMAGAPMQALREAVVASLHLLDGRDFVSV